MAIAADLLPAEMRVAPAPRPLRIALVYSRMPLPMTRADQHTVAHLIAYLSARGHSVDLFALDTGEPMSDGTSGVAGRCNQNGDFSPFTPMKKLKCSRHKPGAHVLECQCRTMKEFKHTSRFVQCLQRDRERE